MNAGKRIIKIKKFHHEVNQINYKLFSYKAKSHLKSNRQKVFL